MEGRPASTGPGRMDDRHPPGSATCSVVRNGLVHDRRCGGLPHPASRAVVDPRLAGPGRDQAVSHCRAGAGIGLVRTLSPLPRSMTSSVRAVLAMSSTSSAAHSSTRAPVWSRTAMIPASWAPRRSAAHSIRLCCFGPPDVTPAYSTARRTPRAGGGTRSPSATPRPG